MQPLLHLASSSPRRREILAALGVTYTYSGVDIEEVQLHEESAIDMVLRLAGNKALAAAERQGRTIPILGADTVVVCVDRILGKPKSKEDALGMLALLSGKTHQVMTGVALLAGDTMHTCSSQSTVQFRDIEPDEALAYWQSREPQDKAGAYAIQGKGGVFVKSLTGSYSGVVGLPVFETSALLAQAGIDVLDNFTDETK